MILFHDEIPRQFPSVVAQTSNATIFVHACTFLSRCVSYIKILMISMFKYHDLFCIKMKVMEFRIGSNQKQKLRNLRDHIFFCGVFLLIVWFYDDPLPLWSSTMTLFHDDSYPRCISMMILLFRDAVLWWFSIAVDFYNDSFLQRSSPMILLCNRISRKFFLRRNTAIILFCNKVPWWFSSTINSHDDFFLW